MFSLFCSWWSLSFRGQMEERYLVRVTTSLRAVARVTVVGYIQTLYVHPSLVVYLACSGPSFRSVSLHFCVL